MVVFGLHGLLPGLVDRAVGVTCRLWPVHNAVRKFSFASVWLSMFSTVGSAP